MSEQGILAENPGFVETIQPGDPLDEATVMGAIVDATQLKTVLGYIEAGKADGARLLSGGQQSRTASGGYFVGESGGSQAGKNTGKSTVVLGAKYTF